MFYFRSEAIKSAARNTTEEAGAEHNVRRLSRVRLLLTFYEFLEKFMFNAFDGCSVALPLAPKVYHFKNHNNHEDDIDKNPQKDLTWS